MAYIYVCICIILIAIGVLLNCVKKINSSEAYVIERKGSFYKVATSGFIFLIPFIDKIKGIVNLSTKIIKGNFHKAILGDNSVITYQCKISYHINEPQKATYSNENIELKLEFLANTVLRDIVAVMKSSEMEYLNDKIKHEMKVRMNKSSYELGCEIDDVQVKLVNEKDYVYNSFKDDKTSVVNNNESKKYSNIGIFISVIIFILLLFGVHLTLDKLYIQTQNLIFYFIKISIPSLFAFVGCIITSFAILNIPNMLRSQKHKVSENKSIYKFKKVKKSNVILLAIIFLFIYEFLQIPESVDMGNSYTNLLGYKIAILQDIVSDETTIIKTGNIFTQKSSTRRRRRAIPASIRYKREDNNDTYYEAETNNKLVKIVDNLKKLENEITIEYYNNSKIIKSIDGIDKFDYDGFYNRATYLVEEKKKQIEQEKIEQEKIKKEQEEQEKIKREKEVKEKKIQEAAIGKNIEVVKKELEENEVSDYSIKYISSKLYSKGIIAFSEKSDLTNNKIALYVVKDNSTEDMVKMPKLEFGMTKERVIQLLEANELNYDFYIKKLKNSDNARKGLQTYPYSEGTLLPRGLKVRIFIYE